MGLDMFLFERNLENGQPRKGREIAYWRKANAIHRWFVENVQDGEDDCNYYLVTVEQLRELLNLCKEVKSKIRVVEAMVQTATVFTTEGSYPKFTEGQMIDNSEEIAELLPTQSGFFFGKTDYNNYYVECLDETIEQLENILNGIDPTEYRPSGNKYGLYYCASW